MKDFIDLCAHYFLGRHTYWTNIKNFDINEIIQVKEDKVENISQKKRQGGQNVYHVVEYFINKVVNK